MFSTLDLVSMWFTAWVRQAHQPTSQAPPDTDCSALLCAVFGRRRGYRYSLSALPSHRCVSCAVLQESAKNMAQNVFVMRKI